jgi:tetratricopeptide (TPR) repeat protein
MMTRLSIQRTPHGIDFLICLFLVMVVVIVFWQVKNHSFITYDDDEYVTKNIYVQKGLTSNGVRWALGFNDVSYWHPLTWLSHMLDVQLYGMNAGRHHLTSVLFHMANCILLFLIFNRMTGAVWRSAFVAVLFAVHPLNVESVAWVAERKSVLSTFFWMLTLYSYIRYVERPGALRYLWILLFFMLGLTAKPMLVTLPFVLLLLDFWPLGRMTFDRYSGAADLKEFKDRASFFSQLRFSRRLIFEKLPLFALAAISVFGSSLSVQRLGIVLSAGSKPIGLRMANAVVSYVKYLGKVFWPWDLTFIYPYPRTLPALQIIGSVFILLCLTAGVLAKLKKAPFLAVGWLWYLGTLIPVIGLVQAGFWPAMADRFAYIPAIGLFVIIAWGTSRLLRNWHHKRTLLSAAGAATLILLMAATWVQVGYWRNSTVLFEHALEVTENNYLIHNNLGNIYFREGKLDKAIHHYSESLRINPGFALAHNNLGAAMLRAGDIEKAIFHFQTALRLNPDDKDARNNLNKTLVHKYFGAGNYHLARGELDQARQQYQQAISIQPQFIPALNRLAEVYALKENYKMALSLFSEIVGLEPDKPDAYYRIACIYSKLNRVEESVAWLTKAVQRGFNDRELLETDNKLENIREALAYQDLIRALSNNGNRQ